MRVSSSRGWREARQLELEAAEHDRVTALGQWHPWFAWRPVYVKEFDSWAWLEEVGRRAVRKYLALDLPDFNWEYCDWKEHQRKILRAKFEQNRNSGDNR